MLGSEVQRRRLSLITESHDSNYGYITLGRSHLGVFHVPLHEVGPARVADEHARVRVLVQVERGVVGLLRRCPRERLHAGRLELGAAPRRTSVISVGEARDKMMLNSCLWIACVTRASGIGNNEYNKHAGVT